MCFDKSKDVESTHPMPLEENQVASQSSRELIFVVKEVVVQATRKV
jgi:hypothetical protein